MQFKMFHKPKPRQFNYQPIYHDPEKEAKEKKLAELGELKSKFHEERQKNMRSSSQRKNINISIYLVIIMLLLYFIFFS
jgi:hypothetical protein